jgi:hypothetical protein
VTPKPLAEIVPFRSDSADALAAEIASLSAAERRRMRDVWEHVDCFLGAIGAEGLSGEEAIAAGLCTKFQLGCVVRAVFRAAGD